MFSIKSTPPMSRTLRVLAALLAYPDATLRGDLPEMTQLLHEEAALSAPRRSELAALMQRLGESDPLKIEADYVSVFDRGRATSLHLFEHVHGDSRDRGPALIDLGQTYANAGLYLAEGELPDYLPAVLEFLSTQPPRTSRGFLGEMSHIFNALFGALHKHHSGYASVLGALLELAGEKATPVDIETELPLDETWDEPPAFDGCNAKGQSRPGDPQPVHVVRKRAASNNTGASA